MLTKIAWRNVWRNPTRSMVILLAVALGLWGGIFSDAFMNGMANQQVYSAIHTETGDIQLNQKGYLLNHDLRLRISHADSILEVIRTDPRVEAASSLIEITSMASTASGSTGILLNGIEPSWQRKISNLSDMMVSGDYFRTGEPNQVVISQKLSEKLHVKLHSRLVLTLQTFSGDITYGAFKVSGIYRTHNSDFDQQMVFVRFSDLENLINFPRGDASLITVLLKKDPDADSTAVAFSRKFPSLQVQTWVQLSPFLELLTGKTMLVTYIFVGIILVALAFGIINTMLMAVLDRTREIGMLLSIGMKPSRIFGMILLETVFLSVSGAAAGIGLSLATIGWFGKTGINLSIIAEGVNALGYSSMVYPSLGPEFYLILTGMVIGVALLSGLIPARRAVGLKPAEAVRGD